jgi:hypothetical protein
MSKQRLPSLLIEAKPFLRLNGYQTKRYVSQAGNENSHLYVGYIKPGTIPLL